MVDKYSMDENENTSNNEQSGGMYLSFETDKEIENIISGAETRFAIKQRPIAYIHNFHFNLYPPDFKFTNFYMDSHVIKHIDSLTDKFEPYLGNTHGSVPRVYEKWAHRSNIEDLFKNGLLNGKLYYDKPEEKIRTYMIDPESQLVKEISVFYSNLLNEIIKHPDSFEKQNPGAKGLFNIVVGNKKGKILPKYRHLELAEPLKSIVVNYLVDRYGNIEIRVLSGLLDDEKWANLSGQNIYGFKYGEKTTPESKKIHKSKLARATRRIATEPVPSMLLTPGLNELEDTLNKRQKSKYGDIGKRIIRQPPESTSLFQDEMAKGLRDWTPLTKPLTAAPRSTRQRGPGPSGPVQASYVAAPRSTRQRGPGPSGPVQASYVAAPRSTRQRGPGPSGPVQASYVAAPRSTRQRGPSNLVMAPSIAPVVLPPGLTELARQSASLRPSRHGAIGTWDYSRSQFPDTSLFQYAMPRAYRQRGPDILNMNSAEAVIQTTPGKTQKRGHGKKSKRITRKSNKSV